MRAWIGHYVGAPKTWFIMVGRNLDEAIELLDASEGEPDIRTIKEVKHFFSIDFHPRLGEYEDGEVMVDFYKVPPEVIKPERERGGDTHFQNDFMFGEELEYNDHVAMVLKNPLPPPDDIIDERDRALAEHMRISQQEVLDKYKKYTKKKEHDVLQEDYTE
jgi:hypothetical protein